MTTGVELTPEKSKKGRVDIDAEKKKAYMPLSYLKNITASSNYCVRAFVDSPPKAVSKKDKNATQGGKQNYTVSGYFYDSSDRRPFAKWSTSIDDLNIVHGACYELTKPSLEELPNSEARWCTAGGTRIKITKLTKLKLLEPAPEKHPTTCLVPTVDLADVEKRLKKLGIHGTETRTENGKEITQAKFMLVDLRGTVVHVDRIKSQATGYSYDCTVAHGGFEMIITVWTPKDTPEVNQNDQVFLDKVKIKKPEGDIQGSLSLAPRDNVSKTTGNITILLENPLKPPASTRRALNQAWQKTEYTALPMELTTLKNLEEIVDQVPDVVEGSEVFMVEVRGVWINSFLQPEKWFEDRCVTCRKTDGCSCGTPKKPGLFGRMDISDGTSNLEVAVGDQDNGSIVGDVLCIKRTERLPAIFNSDCGSLILKNRLHLRLRIAPYDHYTQGLKNGVRIVSAKSDMYLNNEIKEEFGEPLPFEPTGKSINEVFLDELDTFGPELYNCQTAICLAIEVTEGTSSINEDNQCHEFHGSATILKSDGQADEAQIFGLDSSEAGTARFTLIKGINSEVSHDNPMLVFLMSHTFVIKK